MSQVHTSLRYGRRVGLNQGLRDGKMRETEEKR